MAGREVTLYFDGSSVSIPLTPDGEDALRGLLEGVFEDHAAGKFRVLRIGEGVYYTARLLGYRFGSRQAHYAKESLDLLRKMADPDAGEPWRDGRPCEEES